MLRVKRGEEYEGQLTNEIYFFWTGLLKLSHMIFDTAHPVVVEGGDADDNCWKIEKGWLGRGGATTPIISLSLAGQLYNCSAFTFYNKVQ